MVPRAHIHGRIRALALFSLLASLAGIRPAAAAVPAGFVDELVLGGFGLPVGIAFLPDGRLLVVEQKTARIDLVRMGPPATSDSVGVVPSVNITGTERGLLGIAVDPGWPGRPYVYTHSTSTTGKIRISRFKVSGVLSDPAGLVSVDAAGRYDLVNDIPDNADNHNGGTVRFGIDGMLYVSLGEDATPSAAQDTSTLRGVILRLDVSRLPDGPGTAARALVTPPDNPFSSIGGLNARLVWAYGLRNPFRLQVDRFTGALLIADVGQDTWEELDYQPAGGLNFGWSHYEGNAVYNAVAPLTGSPTFPIYVVDHASTGAAAVMSAGIYRRPGGARRGFPAEYEGDAFVSDYYAGFLRRLHRTGSSWSLAAPVPGQPTTENWGDGFQSVSDYAIGSEGGLWYCKQFISGAHSGEIHRILNAGTTSVEAGTGAVSFGKPHPLPSTGRVDFDWSLASEARVSLVMLDVRGRVVRRIVAPGMLGAGAHHATWDGLDERGRAAGAGIYFARLEVGGASFQQRVPILR